MRAVDTNVIVRILTDDHPEQARRARKAVDEGEIIILTSVLLESAWVLYRLYEFSKPRVIRSLHEFIGLPGLALEEPARVKSALEWAAIGMDLADALHLAGAEGCTAFISFDRALGRRAASVAALPVVEP